MRIFAHRPRAMRPCRLLFELGGVPEREMQKLKEMAEALGKGSFAFAFYMDTQKAEGAVALKTNDAAEGVFEPQQPMVVDEFTKCEGLSRIAFMDGNSAVMLGKVTAVNSEKTW